MSPRADGAERRIAAISRQLSRQAEHEILTLHLTLVGALNGRTSADHAYRAARRAAQAVRRAIWGDICPVCQRPLGHGVWITYKGAAYRVESTSALARERAYCSEHCAVRSLMREGWPFLVEPYPFPLDPDATVREEPRS